MSGRESWGADIFDRIYAGSDDPWHYQTSPYERAKYADTLAALPERVASGLEVGCSIGVMTALLAPRCRHLTALDGAAAAVAQTSRRCAGLKRVEVLHARVPDELPQAPGPPGPGRPGGWDLILLSEMLYFLSPADLDRLAGLLVQRCTPHAAIVMVNWTGETDTPCTGDQAAELFATSCAGFRPTFHRRGGDSRQHYRLDRLDRP